MVDNDAKRGRGRPAMRPEDRKRNNITLRLRDSTRATLERVAEERGRSVSEEIEYRVEQSLLDPNFPPELTGLAELFIRAMFETGNAISGANRWSGHGVTPWLGDPYARKQADEAVRCLSELSLPEGDPTPHGLFAPGAAVGDLGDKIGKQIALGIIEVMAGRHKDDASTAALWTPRVREKLGAIGDRLIAHAPAQDYFAGRSEAARWEIGADNRIRAVVKDEPDAESDAVEG
jgi:hypothetical protein